MNQLIGMFFKIHSLHEACFIIPQFLPENGQNIVQTIFGGPMSYLLRNFLSGIECFLSALQNTLETLNASKYLLRGFPESPLDALQVLLVDTR